MPVLSSTDCDRKNKPAAGRRVNLRPFFHAAKDGLQSGGESPLRQRFITAANRSPEARASLQRPDQTISNIWVSGSAFTVGNGTQWPMRFLPRSWSISLELRLYKLRQVIKGWISCYGISDGIKSRLTEIDSWLRFRIRMMIRKQWKTIQEREWGLLKPGCKRAQAHSYACARQFYARCASTFLNKFITNSRLSKQGLIKCTEYIEKAHARALERAAGGTPACPVV